MNAATDRKRFRATLATLADKTKAKIPALNGRVEKAVRLALAGDVELHENGTATVYSSSDPTRRYEIIEGTCTCRDWQAAPQHLCQHRLSAGLVQKARELLPLEPVPAPAPMPTLPEAPVSITMKATLHGFETLVTLRGVDFASVKAQVEQASQWLQAQSGQTAAATPQCPTHGAMKRSTKGEGWYCPHKLQDGSWCTTK
jgi:hypothetical protein